MSVGSELDIIVRNLRSMQKGEAVGTFPKELTVWDRLFESPIVDCLPIGILLLDINFTIRRFNSTYGGYITKNDPFSAADCVGRNYFECFPSASTTIVDHFLHVKASRQQLDSYHQPYTDWDSIEQNYWNAHLVPLRNRSVLTGFLLVTMNVTEQVNTLRLIRRQQCEIERLRTSLETILHLRDQVKDEVEENVLANTRYIVEPLVDKLKHHLDKSDHLPYIEGIESVVKNLGSGFAHRLGIGGYGLTPKEMQIASMINVGKSTKEIADCLHLSTESVDFHRKNIRTKLGCKNTSVNLKTALSSLISQKRPQLNS